MMMMMMVLERLLSSSSSSSSSPPKAFSFSLVFFGPSYTYSNFINQPTTKINYRNCLHEIKSFLSFYSTLYLEQQKP